MQDIDLAREQMEIVGSDGQHVGALLQILPTALVLAGTDSDHARIPLAAVDSIDTVIRLAVPAREAIETWLSGRSGAFDSPPITS